MFVQRRFSNDQIKSNCPIEANRIKSCIFCEWSNQTGYPFTIVFSIVKLLNLKYTHIKNHNFSFVYKQSQNINLPKVTITRYLQIENIRFTYLELTRLCLFYLKIISLHPCYIFLAFKRIFQ